MKIEGKDGVDGGWAVAEVRKGLVASCCHTHPPNCGVFMVGGVVCVGNMLLNLDIYTPKTKIHTKRCRHPRGSHLCLPEVSGRLLRAVM